MTDAFELAETLVDETVAANPVPATYLGVPGSNHLWGDVFGPAGVESATDHGAMRLDLLGEVVAHRLGS